MLDRLLLQVPTVDVTLPLRAFFLVSAAGILFAAAVPALSVRYLAYGSRSQPPSSTAGQDSRKHNGIEPQIVSKTLDHLATYQVPHSYFAHFYILSVAASIFWACQHLTNGSIIRFLTEYAPSTNSDPSLPIVSWALMLAQGVRRLYESFAFRTDSKNQMWILHYFVGMCFYLAISVSAWVESARSLPSSVPSASAISSFAASRWAPLSLFVAASCVQHIAHAELFRLRTKGQVKGKSAYSMPQHPLFKATLAPHYMAECLIYFALALLAAPRGSWVNGTVLAGLVFVVVNLGVTAAGTKRWYASRFGEEAVKGRARMIAWVW